jgi:hypothetical protein
MFRYRAQKYKLTSVNMGNFCFFMEKIVLFYGKKLAV